MRKFVVCASLAVAVGISVPSWGCTPVDVLPSWIDPMTAPQDYPCVTPGMPMSDPGSIPFYDDNGSLGFFDTRGRFLNQYGMIVDNVKRYMFGDELVSVGEWVIIMQRASEVAGRALHRNDLIP